MMQKKSVLHATSVISSFTSAPKQAVVEQRLAPNRSVRGAHEERQSQGMGRLALCLGC